MEAAAKTVEELSKSILPDKPHQLSFVPDWRYRPPPDADDAESRGAKRRFEEWHNTRLQYLTFVSEADRGTVLTRSYYDMREEPAKLVPREVSALAKSGSTGEKKKLSLSDYKNKKTGVASASPPEPAIAKKKESERAASQAASPAGSTPNPATQDTNRSGQDSRKPDGSRARDLNSTVDNKPKHSRDSLAPDMRLPPKPSSLPPRPPSPAGKRRIADVDDESRPQKRSRPDDRRPGEERNQSNRDDTLRRKDKPSALNRDRERDRDTPTNKDDKGHSTSSLLNGRSILKNALGSGRSTPPPARGKDSVNGTRHNAIGSNRSTPTKPDASAKSFVPPLLSPLNLGFEEKERRENDDDSSLKRERAKRDDVADASGLSRRKQDTGSVPRKSRPSTLAIPPLLSPTLPPAVEAELQRQKKSSSDSSDELLKDRRNALGIKKQTAVFDDHDEEESDEEDEPTRKFKSEQRPEPKFEPKPASKLGHKRRLIIVLNVPKKLRPSFSKIVGHGSSSQSHRKDSQSQSEREVERDRERDQDRDRDQRPGSDEPGQHAQARKRPAGGADGQSDSIAVKRPRSSEVPAQSKLATPSTPSKKTTAMSRVSSANSLAQTPNDMVTSTPSASTSADRRPNGSSDGPEKSERPEAKHLREKEARLRSVGTKLKHEADLTMKKARGDGSASLKGRPEESKVKLGYVLSLESIIAFVMGFHAHNLNRAMHNKRGDPTGWGSMFPLMEFLQNEMRRVDVSNWQPLYAMLLLLQVVSLDEMIKCYVHSDVPLPQGNMDALVKHERKRYKMWPHIHEVNASIRNPNLRVDVKPWATIDDITDACLRLLRRWCSEEKIDWTPEQTLKDDWPVKVGQGYR